jgi:hypothetical protein
MPKNPSDLAKRRFGFWTAMRLHPERAPDRQALWLCKCDCGTERLVKAGSLRSGASQSCGVQCPIVKSLSTSHPLYTRWRNMHYRCYSPNSIDYENYGARGITVCERWMSFENFVSDMEPTYQPGLQIDRKDNNAGYSPENCHWVTVTENIRNRRNTIFIETERGRLTTVEAAKLAGVSVELFDRRRRSGWSIDRLFTTPNPKQGKRPDH